VKSSRRNRKSRPQGNREAVSYRTGLSEGNHADPSIWPPAIEDGDSSQRVSSTVFSPVWPH
jgi:hypothetical protein